MNRTKKETIIMAMSIIAIVTCVISSVCCIYLTKQKVAFIKSTELVYGYLGMQEAHDKITKKEDGWKANIDTLKNDYERSLSKYRADAPELGPKEKEEREKYLIQQKQSLENYQLAINKKIDDEDTKITQGVLNQINAFVADYGKQHGYDMIIGTTSEGNLLYAKAEMDITTEVLKALNQNYKGGNK